MPTVADVHCIGASVLFDELQNILGRSDHGSQVEYREGLLSCLETGKTWAMEVDLY